MHVNEWESYLSRVLSHRDEQKLGSINIKSKVKIMQLSAVLPLNEPYFPPRVEY